MAHGWVQNLELQSIAQLRQFVSFASFLLLGIFPCHAGQMQVIIHA